MTSQPFTPEQASTIAAIVSAALSENHLHAFKVLFTEDNITGLRFHCYADDANHAKEQCINAYPSAHITSIIKAPHSSCGRIYLVVGFSKITKSSPIAKALGRIHGIKITSRPLHPGAAFYMGYDNATSLIASKAEHVAARLRDAGFPAGVGYDSD